MCLSPAVSVWSLNTTRPFASKDASILPSGLQAQKSATCRLLKLLVSNCQSSAEKLPDFSAEVGEVLLSVSQPPVKGFLRLPGLSLRFGTKLVFLFL